LEAPIPTAASPSDRTSSGPKTNNSIHQHYRRGPLETQAVRE
jgi:hypothetical protein